MCHKDNSMCNSHKYTNIHNFYSVKYYNLFTKWYYRSSLHIKNSSTYWRECVRMYFLKAALNFAMSFLRTVTLGGKLLKIFMPALNALFWKQVRLAFGLWRWCLFLVLILLIDEFVWKFSLLLIIQFIKGSMYWHGTGGICNCYVDFYMRFCVVHQ
jgi:hypothetical protein